MTVKQIRYKNSLLDQYHFSQKGFSCKVFPNLGGSIQELTIEDVVIIKELQLDSAGIENYKQLFHGALLFPFPNRIENGAFSFGGEDFELPINEPSPQNAIHGLVSSQIFPVIEVDDNYIILHYAHQNSPGFPFPFDFRIGYLFSENGIKVKFTAANTGVKSFPFGIGWHPYFELGDYTDCSIQFAADRKYITNETFIPTGFESYSEEKIELAPANLDTAYKLTENKVILKSPHYDLKMVIPDGSFLQLYTPPDRRSVAIEPMTCIANAFNNGIGLRTLEPNAAFIWEISLQFYKNT